MYFFRTTIITTIIMTMNTLLLGIDEKKYRAVDAVIGR